MAAGNFDSVSFDGSIGGFDTDPEPANDYGGFVRRSRIERERRQLHESNVKAALKIMMDFLTGTGR